MEETQDRLRVQLVVLSDVEPPNNIRVLWPKLELAGGRKRLTQEIQLQLSAHDMVPIGEVEYIDARINDVQPGGIFVADEDWDEDGDSLRTVISPVVYDIRAMTLAEYKEASAKTHSL